jgi:long-chain acyl-CoA synthetase
MPGVEVEIIDEEENLLPWGSAGRLRVKSPGSIDGYLDDPAETARAFRDGWFYSEPL